MSNEGFKRNTPGGQPNVPLEEMPTQEQAQPDLGQQPEWAAMLNQAMPQPAGQRVVEVRPPRRRVGMLVAAGFGIVGLVVGAALMRPAFTRSSINATTVGAVATTAGGTAQAQGSGQGGASAPAASNGNGNGNVQIVRQGFAQLPAEADGGQKLTYAVVLRNPRSNQVAADVHAIISFTSRNGVAIEPEDKDLNALLPGQTSAVTGDVDGAGVTQMSVRVVVTRWAPAQGLSGSLTASGINSNRVADELTTTASVHSTLARNLSDVKVTAVYYNGAGQIIGGDDDSIDFLPANGTAPVTIDSSHVPMGVARTAVYANPDGLFTVPDSSD